MKAALLALLMAGCATIPDGSVTFTPDELMTMATNFAALQEKCGGWNCRRVPLCNEADWRRW